MTLFAFLHIRAFSYKPYLPAQSPDRVEAQRTPRLRSLCHAMDFRETFREIWLGWIYMWDKICGKEPSRDVGAQRIYHYEGAFGRTRAPQAKGLLEDSDKMGQDPVATLPQVEIKIEEHVDVDIEGEKQWLGLGDDYAYGLHYSRRERSDSLGVQIEKELEKRGLTGDFPRGKSSRQPSWWHRIYSRFSEYRSEGEQEQSLKRSQTRLRRIKSDDDQFLGVDDTPSSHNEGLSNHDILAPPPVFSDPSVTRQLWDSRLFSHRNTSGLAMPNSMATVETDSLFGRIFPYTIEGQPVGAETSPSLSSHVSFSRGGRERLLTSTHQLLEKYYEFGSSSRIPLVTRPRHIGQPEASAIQATEPFLEEPQVYHRRESAVHFIASADSLPPFTSPSPSSPPPERITH
ncbi:hypothetical protein H0H87_004136 [Tephrocybe sp. NHM501043]|nr:hypothetical protein H0H87_004136 [Tephrocybe sp. NHM501043]